LEGEGYACAAADLAAAGVGAPHIRQRLYWVAHLYGSGLEVEREQQAPPECPAAERSGKAVGLDISASGGRERERHQPAHGIALQAGADTDTGAGPTNGFWKNPDWLGCTDGKWRPVESGSFPLAHGIAGRVGRLRGYGNAICAPLAASFIQSVRDCINQELQQCQERDGGYPLRKTASLNARNVGRPRRTEKTAKLSVMTADTSSRGDQFTII
jgi:DNA (cytosine-5)-methyltransferase 1